MRLGKLLAALVLLCPLMAHATACPTGYGYAKQVQVDFHYVNSTLTNKPVYVGFNGNTPSSSGLGSAVSQVLPDLKTTANGGKVLSSGNDIVFCDAYSGGNLLNFDRAQYSATTGQAEFWVGRTLSSTANTSIWMFYGKASDTDHSAAAALWSAAGYMFVQHYADGSTLSVVDSAGTATPVNHSGTATSGRAGGAVGLVSASTQYVAAANAINPGSNLTVEAWVNPTSYAGCQMVADNTNFASATGYFLGIGASGCAANGNVQFIACGSGCSTTTMKISGTVATGSWNFIAGTMTGTALAGMHLYINATEPSPSGTATGAGVGTSANNLTIGTSSNLGAGRYFNGQIDEFRVGTVVQSADWESFDYYQMSAPFGVLVMMDANTPASMTSGAYCAPLTVNHSQVPNTDQTNYPLLVRGTYGWMADTAHGGFAVTGNSGHDIRFYSNSGCTTALNFQRVYWTSTTGDSSWRVRIPTLSHTTDTTVYVRIGSSSDTSDLSTAWMGSYGYIGVYAGSDPASVGTSDSGSAGLPLTCAGGVSGALTPSGGGFYMAPGASDTQTCGWDATTPGDTLAAHGYPVGSSTGHIRYWFRTTPNTSLSGGATDAVPAGYGKANSSGERAVDIRYSSPACLVTGMEEQTYSGNGPGLVALGPAAGCSPSTSTPFFQQDMNWHVFDFDQPTNGAAYSATGLYLDGVKVTSPAYYGTSTGASVINTSDAACCTNISEIRIGRFAAHGAGYFTGFVGQFEVTNFSMSTDLVQTRYNNELSPSAFYSFGTATPFVGSSTQPIVNVTL